MSKYTCLLLLLLPVSALASAVPVCERCDMSICRTLPEPCGIAGCEAPCRKKGCDPPEWCGITGCEVLPEPCAKSAKSGCDPLPLPEWCGIAGCDPLPVLPEPCGKRGCKSRPHPWTELEDRHALQERRPALND